MKRDKIIYWTTTSIVALGGLIAGIIYFTSPMMAERFKHLGFPDYFRIELATAKILGAVAIILPMVVNRIKEWSYAGFAIVFISATIAHLVVDGASEAISPLIQLLLLVISYVYFTKLKNNKAITGN
ncbi:DoxX family protein [Ferruginibacter sp. SUN106]|uniref:DoxX family protein n=1 Tax=Ferruginibacter sp. SUN106 TaxID=2978348 RepID=UPI003D35BFB3